MAQSAKVKVHGISGIVAGACTLLSLYGLALIGLGLSGIEFLPDSVRVTSALIATIMVVGACIGYGIQVIMAQADANR